MICYLCAMIKPVLDVHTHTIASGHAYSSLQEMATRAAEIGLKILGVTDHGSALPGAPDPLYFWNLGVVPRNMYGVRLLMGSELNILDVNGTLDLDESYYKRMDIRIAGIHRLAYKGGTKEENTQAMINAINNPWTHIISHPGDGTAELDFEPIVLAAKESGTLLEINNSTMNPYRHKLTAHDNNMEILRLCKKYDVPVILGSDAHISFSVGDFNNLWPLLAEAEFPDRLIVNDKPEEFLKMIGQ